MKKLLIGLLCLFGMEALAGKWTINKTYTRPVGIIFEKIGQSDQGPFGIDKKNDEQTTTGCIRSIKVYDVAHPGINKEVKSAVCFAGKNKISIQPSGSAFNVIVSS